MDMDTLLIRLEGPLQAWGTQESKFVIRRTAEAPTKSGVIGLLCAALGLSRREAESRLPELSQLQMGVRIDRPGIRWWDYHTAGARMQIRIAEKPGKTREGPVLSRREYLCDASFLVALRGPKLLIEELRAALKKPVWTLYLGRKCCPPGRPLLEPVPWQEENTPNDPLSALGAVPWQPRCKDDITPQELICLIDWKPSKEEPEAPPDALVWYDVPTAFVVPAHRPRFVLRRCLTTGKDGAVVVSSEPAQKPTPRPPRPRADYRNSEYREKRKLRLEQDHHLCVFCKAPATTVQHVTYRHAGGNEQLEELRALCRLCHDAVTMIEYGHGMGLDRINPEDGRWRDEIIRKRTEIIRFRSLETRRRKLAAEEVE